MTAIPLWEWDVPIAPPTRRCRPTVRERLGLVGKQFRYDRNGSGGDGNDG
ncbi:MAG: hypothetical protein LJE65_11325 [Desulfobacteraceae bacterium]|nr:hypothetical protein [Desulfobacteraceae bacterium]